MMRLWISLTLLGIQLVAACVSAHPINLDCDWPQGMPSPDILLVGEVHGTREAPALVSSLACATLASGMNVVVAIELPVSEQRLIDDYFASEGSEQDKAKLLSGRFWTQSLQDGRSSIAMFQLIQRMRSLKNNELNVEVVAVDQELNGSRDVGMAKRIAWASGRPNTRVIALLGNGHASQTIGATWNAKYIPAGFMLSPLGPRSVLFKPHSGSAWVCTRSNGAAQVRCGEMESRSASPTPNAIGYVGTDGVKPGYGGVYYIQTSTASPPAAEARDP